MRDNGFPALFRLAKPLSFQEGPAEPNNGKLFHLPDWDRWTDARRIKFLRETAESYGRDPRIRDFVIRDVLRHRDSRQYQDQAAAILRWVQTHIAYYNETREQLQSPWYTLQSKAGDCDDISILLATFFESVKLPWRYVLSGIQRSTGKKLRWVEGEPEPSGVKWSHIYVRVGWPPFRPHTWAYAEGTMRNAALGWDVVGASAGQAGVMPEMASYGNGIAIAGGGAAAAATAEAKRGISWRQIGTAVLVGVTTSVLSQVLLDYIRERRKG